MMMADKQRAIEWCRVFLPVWYEGGMSVEGKEPTVVDEWRHQTIQKLIKTFQLESDELLMQKQA